MAGIRWDDALARVPSGQTQPTGDQPTNPKRNKECTEVYAVGGPTVYGRPAVGAGSGTQRCTAGVRRESARQVCTAGCTEGVQSVRQVCTAGVRTVYGNGLYGRCTAGVRQSESVRQVYGRCTAGVSLYGRCTAGVQQGVQQVGREEPATAPMTNY